MIISITRAPPCGPPPGKHAQRENPQEPEGPLRRAELEAPRNRKATFDTKIVAKGQNALERLCDKINLHVLARDKANARSCGAARLRKRVRSENAQKDMTWQLLNLRYRVEPQAEPSYAAGNFRPCPIRAYGPRNLMKIG